MVVGMAAVDIAERETVIEVQGKEIGFLFETT